MKLVQIVALLSVAAITFGDIYMHNPRGSNDRLNEANTNRNNANRLFDSQNNAKGGYCWGPPMSFYEASLLSVEWTNQHGCGNDKLYCNLVLQYMCSNSDEDPMNRVRDGATTDTIPDDPTGPTAVDQANGGLLFGMHEPYSHYQDCKARERNMGLWISDREDEGNLDQNRRSAIFTRQNNNGNRHGYECVEERDYYPYWAPSPWVDIAILTNDKAYCDFYTEHSENVQGRGVCKGKDGETLFPHNEDACGTEAGEWESTDSHGVDAPECIVTQFSRDNHLGNGITGQGNSYNWTLPKTADLTCGENNCNCVLRLRYNISTGDLNADGLDGNNPGESFIDWTYNAGKSPIYDDQFNTYADVELQMALDTTQFGRTFQDRSHVFHINSRSDTDIPEHVRIYNLNVRGKRGNIVQAYPAVEYDFVPDHLIVKAGDYIHFQWTGCDTNPAGNAGEGTDQTDRSNIVQLESYGANVPASDDWFDEKNSLFEDSDLKLRMAYLGQDPSDPNQCLSYEALLAKNGNNEDNAKADEKNCMKLNAASQYFDGGAVKMNNTLGSPYYYMSSRNNNFSNRGQKGVIEVQDYLPAWAIGLVVAGAVLFLGAGGLAAGALYARSHPHSGIANIFSKF